ncbi:aminotransferase class IV [Micrococcus lylae]|uniref:aminotransferase class IV n=1 Tax=Micrococcus lylae TaxID=1273 RepID=UPI000C803595|nr:aminotransferase class IV [Micrococcus lylae]WIK81370.1 aminotransferase class IV [Micrococcus lylae]
MSTVSGGVAASREVLVLLRPSGVAGLVPELADPSAPHLTVKDQGVTRGDGLFETALAVPGDHGALTVRKLGAHLGRLGGSAEILDLPVPSPAQWRQAIDMGLAEFARSCPGTAATVKLTVTRGPETAAGLAPQPTAWVLLTATALPDPSVRPAGLRVLLLNRGLDSRVADKAPWLLAGAKTLSYAVNMAAVRHAKANGADDVLFVSSDGQLLEGPTSTALLVRRDAEGRRELVTPLRQQGILAGTSQAVVFAAAEREGWPLGYGPLTPADLEGIEGLWLASSVRGVAPVLSVDGEPIPVDDELTDRLNAWLREDRDPGAHAVTVD